MRRTVSKAGDALGDSLDVVREFLRHQLAPAGGFQGRDGRSDLYYTVFGLEASMALSVDLPHDRIDAYLNSFAAGESLDLVHLTSLIRCRANRADCGRGKLEGRMREDMISRLLAYRSNDGGFSAATAAPRGSTYGSFLALAACQDLGLHLVDLDSLAESIRSLQMPDGGYSNEPALTIGATPATAAAIGVLHYLSRPVPEAAIRWLLDRAGPRGGFTAIPVAADWAIPDLLSTATALHALSLVGALAEEGREKHLDYLDSLWSTQGGFHGHWGDEAVDCEYTYYGLLSLGCLVE